MLHKGYINLMILVTIITVCILIGGCIEQSLDNGDNESGFTTYLFSYEKKEISIQYPVSWLKFESHGKNVMVTFMPDENNVLLGVFNVSILNGDLLDIDSFKKTHIDTLYDMFVDFNISYENSTTLAGREAYAVLFTFRDSGHTFKRLDTWTVDDGSVYLLTYQVSIIYYDEYISIVEKMVDYFDITR